MDKKIDLYVNGQLSEIEIDELWAELIQDGEQLDYLKIVANAMKVIEQNRKEASVFQLNRVWRYAAAAVVILLIGVMAALNLNNPALQADSVKPIANIELDYYRSQDGVISSNQDGEVLKEALALANRGNTGEAILMLEQARDNAEESDWKAELNLNIGSLYYNNGSYSRAIDNFSRVIEQPEADVLTREKGYWYLGNAYFQLNQLDKAQEAIQQAYELNGAYRRVAKHYLDALASNV